MRYAGQFANGPLVGREENKVTAGDRVSRNSATWMSQCSPHGWVSGDP